MASIIEFPKLTEREEMVEMRIRSTATRLFNISEWSRTCANPRENWAVDDWPFCAA